MVVLEGELVLTLFRHLHPHSCLAYPTILGSVGFQQILSCVAMQASLAEVLALLVLALVTEKAVEVFDPGVVEFAGLLDQQKIDSGHSLRLGAKSVNIHALIPTKYDNGQVIQRLHFGDMRDGREGIDPFEVEIVIGRILRRSVYMVTGCEKGRSECPSEAVVILVFHIDNCLLGPHGCWKWDVRAPSQWLISCDIQPEGQYSVDRRPRPSQCPLFEQLQEVGDGFIKSPFDFAGLEKGLRLVAQHRVCVLLTTVWDVLPKLDLEWKLKLDSIESQDLFLELVMDLGFHFLQKGSYINA